MNHPLREYLEVVGADGVESIRCTKCQFQYCRVEQDWREYCKVRLLSPVSAGSLMAILEEGYRMRQFFCPSCGALVDTDFVENK